MSLNSGQWITVGPGQCNLTWLPELARLPKLSPVTLRTLGDYFGDSSTDSLGFLRIILRILEYSGGDSIGELLRMLLPGWTWVIFSRLRVISWLPG